MRRALDRLVNETFDLLVIGGGITGACVARDASFRGLKVALIDKGDFANATSAHNSKLIHGGLRYLRNFEFGLVRESLRERRIWQRIAPHLVHPLPFLVPIYEGLRERATLAAGMLLYDLLSYDKGRLDDPDQRLPNHSWLTRDTALAAEPVLDAPGFSGAFRYYDAQMVSPERLALECLLDADAHGAALANYVAAERLLLRNGRVEGATVREQFGGTTFDIRAKLTLVATGPWADLFLERALGKPATHKVLRAKGIHVVVPAMTRSNALTVAAGAGHFFVMPWHGHSLIGTTDTAFTGDPDSVHAEPSDIAAFLALVNRYLPRAALTPDMVEYAYAGLRPLVADGKSDTYGASRRAELIDHGKDDGLEGLFSAIGGKWTTSRALAETIVDRIVAKLGLTAAPCTTAITPTAGGATGRFSTFLAEMQGTYATPPPLVGGGVAIASAMDTREGAPRLPAPTVEHLAHLYGTRLPQLLALAAADPALLNPLGTSRDIAAQAAFARAEEMAMTDEDTLSRRTLAAQLRRP